ncbi:MAG: glucuronate isomerase [Bacteroidota bacterium]
MPEPLALHPDRYFDAEPSIRSIARDLYAATRDLPIVGPHGHVDPAILATNAPFPEPTALLIIPDHYIFRMLYAQGIPLEDLGIPTQDGTAVEEDPRVIWQRFAEHYYLFAGTPTGAWLTHELVEVFGVREKLDGTTAMAIYDQINAQLKTDAFRPRALFDRFNIETLTTTDAATDTLEHHVAIAASGWDGDVRPCFRPDALFRIGWPGWTDQVAQLSTLVGEAVGDYAAFIRALEQRRTFFRALGAFATDHAVVEPYTHRLSDAEADLIFQRARSGEASAADQSAFEAHMLMEMARMSSEDGMVMQIHPGSYRNHNPAVYARFGLDKGADIPVATEFTRNLHALLRDYGNHPNFRLVLFTLDESTYSRELAPLAGHYPALRLGPAWWFHDSIFGMTRYRERVTETAGIYNTAGFNDDTRAFCSIPARHDLSRRVDANFLARLVARHIIDRADAERMAKALAYDLVKETYRL